MISTVYSDGVPSMTNGFKAGVTGFIAAQGNFNGYGRILGSDDPNSMRYLGVPLQFGIYSVKANEWYNASKLETTTNFIGGHYSNQYREFNYLNFNQ